MKELLKGKALEDFEKWYCDTFGRYGTEDMPSFRRIPYEDLGFENHNFSMQYGVLVDFFDSVGVEIEMLRQGISGVKYWTFIINNFDYEDYKTERNEARIESIKKAVEIYNGKK